MRILGTNFTRKAWLVLTRTAVRRGAQRGFMMIELMISMVVLSVGLAGILVLMIAAMYTDKRSGNDTASTMVAEHILEQITAQGLQANTPLQITDCAGNALNVATARAPLGGGNGGAFGGNGANLTNKGVIDWTQAFAAVPTDPASGAPYAIRYMSCGANGKQIPYEIRWDIIQMPGSANNRLTVIGARPEESAQIGGLKFIFPVNLRTVD
jgi:prepilin-type N-terminal cleavage/methylation domain-containing protein